MVPWVVRPSPIVTKLVKMGFALVLILVSVLSDGRADGVMSRPVRHFVTLHPVSMAELALQTGLDTTVNVPQVGPVPTASNSRKSVAVPMFPVLVMSGSH